MLLIGENIHIISKKTRLAIKEKDTEYIRELAIKQQKAEVDYIDLNIGPAKKQPGVMTWLIGTISDVITCPLSLDTTNVSEMESGLKSIAGKHQPIINSTSGDPERLETMMNLAATYNTNIIGLTMNNVSGIPKDPEGRLEIAMQIVEKAMELGIENERIFLDPLVLPISVSQDQATETLNSIRVFNEAFDPPVNTIIGLSNVSNGSPKENRDLINRIFLVLAMGCGLSASIVNAFDDKLKQYVRILKSAKASNPEEQLILDLHNMMVEFGELEDITYDNSNSELIEIYKTAQVLLNRNIYAHNYLNI